MNPFERLGVGLDADDAAVKRAYAKKVREHPPERDPVGFQAVYEAFELLRDGEARARAARHLQRGFGTADAEVLRRLDEAEALVTGGHLEAAAAVLEVVTRRAPELDTAWESLVDTLERSQGAEAAGREALRWSQTRPQLLEAQLSAARLRTATYDYDEAREALRAASALAPYDRRVVFARAVLARTREDWDTALTELSTALSLPQGHLSDGRLRCERLRVHIERGAVDAASAELARVDDAEQLTAMGALAASLSKAELAAELFARAKALDASRRFSLPVARTLPHRALSASARELISARLAAPPIRALTFLLASRPARPSPTARRVVKVGLGVALLGVAGVIVNPIALGLALLGGLAMLVGSLVNTRLASSGYFELRPLHLVYATYSDVQVVPLLRITGMTATSEGVALFVENQLPALFLANDQTAGFVRAVLDQRDRLIALGDMDLLETEAERESVDWG